MRKLGLTYWVFLCLLAASCMEDHVEVEIISVDRPNPAVLVESRCFGTVNDHRGNRMRDVVFQAGNDFCTTGSDGIFDFGSLYMEKDAQVLVARSDESAPYIRLIQAELGSVNYEKIVMCDFDVHSQSQRPGIHADEHFSYNYTNGTFLQNQELYSGPIVFALHRYPLNGSDALVQAPIPLFDSWEGQDRLFQPVELFFMEWQGDSGQDLDIAQNHELQVSGTVSSAFFHSNADYQLYYWSSEEKTWKSHESFDIDDRSFVADIHQSSWWMIAERREAQKYELHLQNENGAFAFQEILVSDPSGERRGPFYSDAEGEVSIYLEPNHDYRIDVMDWCGEMMDSENIKTNQSSIVCHLSDDILIWDAKIMNCQGDEALNSALVIDPRDKNVPLKPDVAGRFSIALSDCLEADIFSVEADNGSERNHLLFSKDLIQKGNQDSIWICEKSPFGGHFDWQGKRIGIDSTLSCNIQLDPLNIELSFKILGLEQLIEITEVTDSTVIGFARGDLFSSGVYEYPIEFHIMQIGKFPGDKFISEFKGDLQFNGDNRPTTIKGKLNARIKDIN